MSNPEYTLKQAVSIWSMASRRYYEHVDSGCEQCISSFAEGPHCEEGHALMLLHNKWIRRMRRVAKLEGVTMTFPTMLTERISSKRK